MTDLFEDILVANGPQTVPNNRDAEESVLGSVLIASEQFREIAGIINQNDFYVHRHRWIFAALASVDKRGDPIDHLTVCNELEKSGQLAEAGGAAYLTHLMSSVPNLFNAVSYAEIVKECSIRRSMLDAANKTAKIAYAENKPIDQCLSEMSKEVRLVYDNSDVGNGFVDMRQAFDKQYDRMDAVARGEIVRVPTGWIDLNNILNGGFANHQFIIVAGRPGTGKTSFMHNVAADVAKNKIIDGCIPIFSLEMDDAEVTDRLIAQEGINLQHIATGRLEESEYSTYTHCMETIPDWPILIDYAVTIEKMRSKLAKIASRQKIALIIVDYIQLMSGNGTNRNLQISEISRNLKLFSREFGAPVLAGSQLSRDIEKRSNKKPMLADLRDSGSLEQDADIVIFLDRPEMYDASPQNMGLANFIVAKHRGGPLGTVQVTYEKQFTRFETVQARKVM